MFRAASCCSCEPTNSTILILSFVTPIDVAPPLFSPFFKGRVHGRALLVGVREPAVGLVALRRVRAPPSVPTPAAGTDGPSFASATDAIAATSATR